MYLVAQSCPTLCDLMDCSPPGSSVWDSPGKNTGVGCHALLQGILEEGLNPGLLHCRHILYHLSHQGSPEERKMDCYSMGIVSILQDEKFLEICCTIVYTTIHLKMVKMVISETCFLPQELNISSGRLP